MNEREDATTALRSPRYSALRHFAAIALLRWRCGVTATGVVGYFVLMITWFMPLALCAQALKVESEPAAPRHPGTATIRLESPAGKEPVALQWDVDLDAAALELNYRQVEVADAAKASGKSVACSLIARETHAKSRFRCIVAGGVNPIPNGPIAIYRYSASRGGKPGHYSLELKNGMSVSRGLKKERLSDAGAALILNN